MTLGSELLVGSTLLTFRKITQIFAAGKRTQTFRGTHVCNLLVRTRRGQKVQQIRLHINGSIYFQLKDAIDWGLLACTVKLRMN